MAARQPLEFTLGETWTINLTCCDPAGDVLTNVNDAQLAIGLPGQTALLVQTKANGATVVSAPTGQVSFAVQPQEQAPFSAGPYQYQARVVLTDGTVSDQAVGVITLHADLFPDAQPSGS